MDSGHLRSRLPLLLGLFSLALAAYGAEEDDRRRQYEDAYKTLEKGNREKLQPQKMMHDMNKMRLLEEARQARNNKDEDTAQRKEREAMMEQMKSQQLQQQMNQNQQAANQNRERESLVSKNEENSQGEQKKGYDAKVTSLRNGKVPEATEEDLFGPSEETRAVPPPAQLANLSEVPQLPSPIPLNVSPPAPVGGAPGEAPSTAGMLLSDLERLESRERFSIGFNDGAKVNPAAGGAGAAALAEGSAQYRLLTAAVGGSGGAGGEGASGDTDVWGNPVTEKGGADEEGSEGRPRGVAGTGTGAAGLAGALAGRNVLKGKDGKGALDGDFFAACPGPEELEKAEAEGKKVKMTARCRKFVARCESELEQAENPGRRDPVEPSEACRKWKEAEAERIAAKEEEEKEKKGSVSDRKKGKAAPKKGSPGRRTAQAR